MSKHSRLSRRFWVLAVCLGIVTCLIAGFAAFNSTFNTVSSRMAGIVEFTKSQSLTYDSFNDASTTKSLLRSIESAGQLARDVAAAPQSLDESTLRKYASELSLTGVYVLSCSGEVVSGVSTDDSSFEDIAADATAPAALDVAKYPSKTYTSRVKVDDGSYVDIACVGRIDEPGVIVGAYHTPRAFANRYSLTLQSMVAGYDPQSNGSIVVETDDQVIAANMLDAQQLQENGLPSDDMQVLAAIKASCTMGSPGLVRASGAWYIASFDKARDYFVYTYVPVSDNLGGMILAMVLAAALYAVVVVLFVLVRRQSEHDHLRELVQQEHDYGEMLAESARAAESANTAKTEFLQRMSHDIRTPINGIRGMVEVGNAYDLDIDKQRECRKKIWNASGILLDLVSEVLDMSKLESGEVELDARPTDLMTLNGEICEMLERQAAERGITIESDSTDVAHEHVIASQLHLKRLIMNIASNAVKYNKDGGSVKLTYTELSCENGVATYRIVVKDTGIGMSEEFQRHLFEPFSREVQKTDTHPSGTGLGTVIAKQLCELMGGTISFASELGHGTTCTMVLPLTVDSQASTRREADQTQGAGVSLAGCSILLAEDNELNREIAEFMLDQAGAKVTTAFDGREALDAFSNNPPGTFDLILMDIMMPNMTGYEAIRAIRALDRPDAAQIPIVAMSANAFTDDVRASRAAGMNEHLAKPIDADKLVKAIAKFMR